MAENITDVTDSSFDAEVLKASGLVLVDFWAPWCSPCKAIAPLLEEFSKQFAGKIKIAKVNTDENPKSPALYNVRGIPNLIFFRDGKVIDQVVGALRREALLEIFQKHIQ
jgi:thioredoxin 1